MKCFKFLVILFCIHLNVIGQKNKDFKNSFQSNQSLLVHGENPKSYIRFETKSTDIGYSRLFKNLGLGLGLNHIRMAKASLGPIRPVDELFRKDNLHLYYMQALLSYRFVNFCSLKNLKVSIDFAPAYLVGGINHYYTLETGSQNLMKSSRWNNSKNIEYETKFNVYGRIGISYIFFERYEFGINLNTYLRYIAPTLMSLAPPFYSNNIQLNKSSFLSAALKFNF